jgi:hypothetical protein
VLLTGGVALLWRPGSRRWQPSARHRRIDHVAATVMGVAMAGSLLSQ